LLESGSSLESGLETKMAECMMVGGSWLQRESEKQQKKETLGNCVSLGRSERIFGAEGVYEE